MSIFRKLQVGKENDINNIYYDNSFVLLFYHYGLSGDDIKNASSNRVSPKMKRAMSKNR